MEYVQERIATLHDLGEARPDAPAGRAAVVLPMTDREFRAAATTRILRGLESVGPGRVVVPLRSDGGRVAGFRDWLESFDLPLDVLWCGGPAVGELLAAHGVDAPAGKGRDVWLGLGTAAASHDYVVCHDADTASDTRPFVPRLLHPLAGGYRFSKGYYARVEAGRLYGRLFRLFYAPLVRALDDAHDAPVIDYLAAFRYALAGEFAVTADLARELRVERRWGLEVGTLGDAFAAAGFGGTAQVDLGSYAHDHRGVAGPGGLGTMSADVGAALFRVLADHGVQPDFGALPGAYRRAAERFVTGYAVDAAFNGLDYDAAAERGQVDRYADAIGPPGPDDRLPRWADLRLEPAAVLAASREDLGEAPRAGAADD